MKITKQQLIEASHKVGFTNEDYGLLTYDNESDFNGKIGVCEYAVGDQLLELFKELGIEVIE
jgi:hypothetical protein